MAYQDVLFGGAKKQGTSNAMNGPATSGGTQQNMQANSQQGAPSNPWAQPTFAQMQQQGQARPAPQLQNYQNYSGSQQGQQMRNTLAQQVQQQMANPSRYNTQAYRQIAGAAQSDIDADYQQAQRGMNEDMARRGLSESSYGAQAYQSLAGQRQRAIANMNAALLKDAAATMSQDQSAANQMGMNFAGLAGSQDLADYEANRVGTAMNNENAMAMAGFNESGRQFDTQQQLAQLLGIGGLSLDQDRLAMQGYQFDRGLDFQGEQSQQDRMLQQMLQGNQLGFSREQLGEQARQFNTSTMQTEQDRELQRQLAIGTVGGQSTVDRMRAQSDADLARLGYMLNLMGMGVDMDALRQMMQNGGQTQTGTTTNPIGSVPTTNAPATDGRQRRPGESMIDWLKRVGGNG